MNDTVERLMALADKYRDGCNPEATGKARQALQDKLTRLFTPLSDPEIAMIERDAWTKYSGTPIALNTTHGAVMVRMAEKAHGITGDSE